MKLNVRNIGTGLKKNAPLIFAALSGIGCVATVVMAVKDSPKAADKLKEVKLLHKNEEDRTEYYKDVLTKVAPIYIPTATLCVMTLGCIVGAHMTNKNQQAAIASGCVLVDKAFKEYRGKVVEKFGEETDKEICMEIARNHADYHVQGIKTPDQRCIFIDGYSGNEICLYERELMDAEYHFNRNYILAGAAGINEFYHFVGLPMDEKWKNIGFDICGGIAWIDFEHVYRGERDGMPVYEIVMVFEPWDMGDEPWCGTEGLF